MASGTPGRPFEQRLPCAPGLRHHLLLLKARDLPLYYNASEILDRNLPARRDKTALYSDARTMSFGEAGSEANRVGNALRRLGVRMGDTVALLSLDGAEWVSVFFGTLKLGAISVGINTLLTEKEYAYILDDCPRPCTDRSRESVAQDRVDSRRRKLSRARDPHWGLERSRPRLR